MGDSKEQAQKSRSRIMQSDVPSISLDKALRVPKAIADNYASNPTKPLSVAAALEMQPTSGPFRTLCGASIAYGLTTGGYNAAAIEITDLGKRIVAPTVEGDDDVAMKESALRPKVIGEFLRKYEGNPLPKSNIAQNVLVEMGVPMDRAEDVFGLIQESARAVGFFREINGRVYVDLDANKPGITGSNGDTILETANEVPPVLPSPGSLPRVPAKAAESVPPLDDVVESGPAKARMRRVFITHGKNQLFVAPIKKLLAFGELEPVVSVEKPSTSKPVPDKVMEDMRSCGAAIIHVEDERTLIDSEAQEVVVLNPNVLIEIGAAMALFKRRFILLVKDGVSLPSNLQGLFEVRYQGDSLDGEATIKLLEAINEMKKLD